MRTPLRLRKSAVRAWKPDGRAGFADIDAFDFQHGFCKQPHLVVGHFRRENLRETAFHLVHAGNCGFAKIEKFSVAVRMMGRNFCFWPLCDSPMRTMTSCRSNASDGGSVMSIFSPGVAVFIQASSAMTQAVAAWAMQTSRAVSAKESFSFHPATKSGRTSAARPRRSGKAWATSFRCFAYKTRRSARPARAGRRGFRV